MFAEDLSAFFSTDELAHVANFGGDDVPVIFDDAYALGSVGQSGMASARPVITLPSHQVPAAPVDAPVTVTVAGVATAYVVAAAEPDGTGITRLLLEFAA